MSHFHKVIAVAALSLLAACQSRTEPVGQTAEDVVLRMLPALDQTHSVLLVRVHYDGSDCSGRVRLRRVVNGRLDMAGEVYVGDMNWQRSARELPSFGKQLRDTISFNFKERNRQWDLHTLRSKLVTLSPGDYIISFAECAANGHLYQLGHDKNATIFNNSDVPVPVSGTNFIHVPAGVVIDAGYLEMVKTQQGFLFIPTKATLTAREATANDRQMLEAQFPRLYAKMKFTSFSRFPIAGVR